MRLLLYVLLLLLPCAAFAQSKDRQPVMPDTTTGLHVKKNQILVLPVIARSIETSWSFGVAASFTFRSDKKDTSSRTSNVQGLSLYSIHKQFITAITGTQYFKHQTYILSEQLSYSSFPDKFWGLGKHTPDSAEEDYSFKQYYITPHLMRHLGHNFYIGALFELQRVLDVTYKPGGLFDQEKIAGRDPYLVAGLGMSFTYDNRNNAFSPDKGSFVQLYFDHFGKYLGSDYEYTNIVLDIRHYLKTIAGQVLAVQAYSFNNIGDPPLRSLASLGGNNSMRGYYDGRFRDKQQFVLQAEYRIPVYGRLGLVGFTSCGQVAHRLSDYTLADLKYSYGGGLRFAINKQEKLNLRLDYGFTADGNSGLYFQLGEAF